MLEDIEIFLPFCAYYAGFVTCSYSLASIFYEMKISRAAPP